MQPQKISVREFLASSMFNSYYATNSTVTEVTSIYKSFGGK
jgi:hypothetical protein